MNYEPYPLPPLRLVKGLTTDGTELERLVGDIAEARKQLETLRQRREDAARLLVDAEGELESLKLREQRGALALDHYITRLAGAI
jgi:predicted  nucleic acid-binding Zn-ribbon protein